jgi:branched-chain amino acid transport system permease protein
MSVGLFFQLLVNGLMSGGIYAMIASGFTLILGVMQVFNFAQGQFYMLGAFLTWAIASVLGLPYLVGVLASLVAMAVLGVLFHFLIIKWTLPHGFFHTMLVTVAFGTAIGQTGTNTFAHFSRVVDPVIPGTFAVGSVTISYGKLLVIVGALVVMLALYFFMKTKTGTAMQAAAENREVAGLQGINAGRLFWATMAVGSALCGVAGALIVPVLGAGNTMGGNVFVRAMLVILIGGTGSMSGALLAAFIVGIIESFAFQYVGTMNMVVVFACTALLMFFRPGGLLGKPLPIPGQ